MQVLYVIAIIAIFVLCLALLSTAGKILRSSRVSSGHLAVSRMYDMDRSEEEPREEKRAEERPIPAFAVAQAPLDSIVVDTLAMPEIAAPEVVPAEAILAEPLPAVALPQQVADKVISAPKRTNRAVRSRKPPRRVYNYALEGLLIGVSAWVLLKTQRSTARYSTRPISRDRVA